MKRHTPSEPIIFREETHNLADIDKLRSTMRIWREVDIYELQLGELFEIIHPSILHDSECASTRQAFLKERLVAPSGKFRGNWVYFPWSGVFIHTLTETDYTTLRTNRNRNLITLEEQAKLLSSCVGLVGLSVGSNVAAALVYSGIANHMKLAEFDTLETTNLNRVRGRLEHIGMSKIDLLAEQLYEVHPYLDIIRFSQKMDEDALEHFMTEEPRPRVVFEIIDSFEVKIHLRALARKHRIPVIMVTNLGDRVLMDVERYDLDGGIEYFNGRAGSVPADILENPDVSDADKHKYAVSLAGVNHIPERALDSVAEIGKTLVGRPQLASTVALAGGISAYLVKKIVLGQPLPSRSWLLDLDQLFREETAL